METYKVLVPLRGLPRTSALRHSLAGVLSPESLRGQGATFTIGHGESLTVRLDIIR